MGDSLPPPAEFDLVDSFARLRGNDVEIVLGEPKTELTDAGVVVLRQGKRSVEGSGEFVASAGGRNLTVRVPRAKLADGTWSLGVRRADGAVAPMAARLLVQGRRPLVLLWGAKGGATQLPPHSAHSTKRQVAEAGARVFDRAVSVLPEEQARRLRARARTAARKLLY